MLRLSDYQTIGGGYDGKTQKMKKPRAASGATLETALSERHYLLDARFGVLLEGDAQLLTKVSAALQNPTWGIWLGRKCCIPASPVLVGIAPDAASAFQLLLEKVGLSRDLPIGNFDHTVEVGAAEDADAETLNDTPIAFGAPIGQRHAPRRVCLVRRKSPDATV